MHRIPDLLEKLIVAQPRNLLPFKDDRRPIRQAKVKLPLCLIKQHEDVWGSGDIAPLILKTTLNGCQWAIHVSATLLPEGKPPPPPIRWNGGWLGPAACMDPSEENMSVSTRNRSLTYALY
jgi:hypothetical protein